MGLLSWLRGERGNARDVLANEPVKALGGETGSGLAIAKHAIERGTWVEMLNPDR